MQQLAHFQPDLKTMAEAHNKGRTIVFETVYGSELYGTTMPGSDVDIRGVYMPGLYDFLRETKEEPASLVPDAAFPETDDNLYFPVGLFIDQVIRMKVNAVEIFFAARQARRDGADLHPVMQTILDHEADLITADPAGFVGHARQRAAAYIEGDDPRDKTLQANKYALACLKEAANSSIEAPGFRICDVEGLAEKMEEHGSISRLVNDDGLPILMINQRQMQENERVGVALEVVSQRLERFRRKAFDAEPSKMFKDLSTSLRMMDTARNLMRDGEIFFPVPRAEHYKAIRRGEVDRLEILAEIDAAQVEATDLAENGGTPLPAKYASGEHVPPRDAIVAKLRFAALQSLSL